MEFDRRYEADDKEKVAAGRLALPGCRTIGRDGDDSGRSGGSGATYGACGAKHLAGHRAAWR